MTNKRKLFGGWPKYFLVFSSGRKVGSITAGSSAVLASLKLDYKTAKEYDTTLRLKPCSRKEYERMQPL